MRLTLSSTLAAPAAATSKRKSQPALAIPQCSTDEEPSPVHPNLGLPPALAANVQPLPSSPESPPRHTLPVTPPNAPQPHKAPISIVSIRCTTVTVPTDLIVADHLSGLEESAAQSRQPVYCVIEPAPSHWRSWHPGAQFRRSPVERSGFARADHTAAQLRCASHARPSRS